jgi:hypothetical protein
VQALQARFLVVHEGLLVQLVSGVHAELGGPEVLPPGVQGRGAGGEQDDGAGPAGPGEDDVEVRLCPALQEQLGAELVDPPVDEDVVSGIQQGLRVRGGPRDLPLEVNTSGTSPGTTVTPPPRPATVFS